MQSPFKHITSVLFFFLRSFKKIIWLCQVLVAALRIFNLRCGMWNLRLWHSGFLAVAFIRLVAACGIWFPAQGSNTGPLHWECRVLATGPPGKSLVCVCLFLISQTLGGRNCSYPSLQVRKRNLEPLSHLSQVTWKGLGHGSGITGVLRDKRGERKLAERAQL